jgi:hypothetical protein
VTRRLEHVHGADHVRLRAGDRIRLAERHLEGCQVQDRLNLVLRHDCGDHLGVGDVAGDPGDAVDLGIAHEETRAPLVLR